MATITSLIQLLISLIFLTLVSSHPAPECPCKCGSSYGSHPLVITKHELVPNQGAFVAAPKPQIPYKIYSQLSQRKNLEPQSRSQEVIVKPTFTLRRNEPEFVPVSLQLPMPTTFAQSRTLETSMPEPQIEVSSSAPCQSDELTGRMLEFYFEPSMAPNPSEIKFETYNTEIQEVVPELVEPATRSLEQTSLPVMAMEAQPEVTYMINEPVYQPVKYFTKVSAPKVEEVPVLRSSYVDDMSPRHMSIQLVPSSRSSCECFQQ
ncbi:uncharacterized protein [Chelonus insularis]|uniref:uncharacterized protein n=1 Tax=Chelonus insularis TaxID=460826 RepID=UPI001588B783|nr:uncharacterized protein LOC118066294 [Chelonus insularis]